jgi:competence protein ComEA
MRKLTTALLTLGIAALPVCAQDLPDGPGKETVMTVCTACHGLEDIVASRHTKAEWKKLVDKMISFGAEAKDEEFEAIINYLAKNFGKADAAANLKPSALPAK